jgi:hypothetical protein
MYGRTSTFAGKHHKEESKRYGTANHMHGITGGMHPNSRKVHTPHGTYDSLADVNRIHNISASLLIYRIKSESAKYLEYFYL